MAERPIIFSAPMVRAIIAGQKHMTRRLATSPLRKCEPGDRLWVREALKARNMDLYGALGLTEPLQKVDMTRNDLAVSYAADGEEAVNQHGFDLAWLWKRSTLPAMHMPRSFSRITLEVTGMKVERLCDISEDDAMSEGVEPLNDTCMEPFKAKFASLWNSLHGPGAWEANPAVVAISFRRLEIVNA